MGGLIEVQVGGRRATVKRKGASWKAHGVVGHGSMLCIGCKVTFVCMGSSRLSRRAQLFNRIEPNTWRLLFPSLSLARVAYKLQPSMLCATLCVLRCACLYHTLPCLLDRR